MCVVNDREYIAAHIVLDSDAISSSKMLDFSLTNGTSTYASRQGYQAYIFEPMDTQHGGHVKLSSYCQRLSLSSSCFISVILLWRRCIGSRYGDLGVCVVILVFLAHYELARV